MKTYELACTYGHLKTPTKSTVFVYENRDGSKWYAVMGSENVNLTYDEISNGVHVEALRDDDTFNWSQPINDLDELIRAVEFC